MAKNLELAIELKLNDRNVPAKLKVNEEAVKRFAQSFRNVKTQADDSARAVEKLGSKLAAMGHAAVSLAAIWQGLRGAKSFLDTVGAVQQLDARIRALTAASGEYASAQRFLDDVAASHHKSVLVLADGYARLLPLQQSGILASQESKDILTGLSNAQSALGASSGQLGQVMFGLAQALSSPVVRAEELNQVVEPLPGLLQAMDRAAQLPAGGFRNMVNEGQVTSEFFKLTFTKALEEFQGAAERMGSTVPARFADVENAWLKLVKAVESPVSTVAGGFLKLAAEDVEVLGGAIERFMSSGPVKAFLTEKNRLFGFSGARKEQIEARELEIFQQEIAGIQATVFGPKPDAQGDADAKIAQEKQKGALAALDGLIAGYHNRREKMEAELKALQAAFGAAGVPESDPRFVENARRIREKFADKTPKAKHTPADNDARQILEAELSQQREFLQLEEEALKASFDRKAIDAESYYQRLASLRDADFAAQIEAKRQELSLSTDRGEQAKILSELAVLEAQRAQAAESATQDLIDARQQEKEQVQTLLDAYDQQGAALRKLKEDAEKFQQFLREGLISPEQAAVFSTGFSKQWSDAVTGTKDATDEMSKYADQAARNMQDVFADFLFDPFKDGLSGMLKGFVDTIRRMAAEALSTHILEALNILKPSKNGGTEAGGLLTALFGGTGGGESPQALAAAPAAASLVPDTFFEGLQADFTTGLDGVRSGLAQSGGGLSEFFSGLGSLLSDGLKSLEDGLGGLFSGLSSAGSGIVDGLGSLFSGLGGLFGFASGGYVSGPGSATSDSIPARLSNGEYVLNAAAVSRMGVGLLDWMNGGAMRPAYPAMAFAAGGLVQAAAAAQPSGINALRLVLVDERANVADYLTSSDGERVLLQSIQRNAHSVRQILGA